MTAKELSERFGMKPHEENGAYAEKHYVHTGGGRAASGSIYYYVDKDEKTEFHRIDCDEYWTFVAGAPLEVWQVRDGEASVSLLGTDEGCEPSVFVPRGTAFASKHAAGADDGTFLVCITVPRFDYAGFELITEEEITAAAPETEKFFKD